MTTLTRLPVDTAFVAMLRANLPGAKAVYFADSGDAASGEPPVDAPLPYAIVYQIPGGNFYGPPMIGPEQDGDLIYQVTCIGGTASQAMWLDDRVRQVILDRTSTGTFVTPLSVPGLGITDRRADTGMSGATLTGRLWQTTPQFCVTVCSG